MTTTTTKVAGVADPAIIEAALRIILQPGQVTELRCLDATTREDRRPHTESGYFDDAAKLAQAAARIQSAKGFYFVINPVKPELLARAVNKCRAVGRDPTTGDADILQRNWLLIDCDAKRPSGVSASDAEHEASLEKALSVRDDLLARGWPMPILADSGNGAHLLYRVELPADDGGLIQRCLVALAKLHDDEQVTVDKTVFNPARIWKLYGTIAGKGDPEGAAIGRPQRLSKILEAPEPLEIVSRELLEVLAGPAQPEAKATNGYSGNGAFDLDGWIARSGLEVRGPEDYHGGRKWILPACPWNDQHVGGSAFIIQRANGVLQAGCHHNGCADNDWHALRDLMEPGRHGKRNGQLHHTEFEPEEPDVFFRRPEPKLQAGLDSAKNDSEQSDDKYEFTPLEFGRLQDDYPTLDEPIIDGLLRRCETGNIVSASKVGKSWLSYCLAMNVISGRKFLGQFACQPGRVLLIDNELRKPTIAQRIPAVSKSMGVPESEVRLNLDVWSLRGQLLDLCAILRSLEKVQPREYQLIILDAWYRSLPIGVSENDNAQVMALYNAIDGAAERLECAWLNVHHSSKGSQSEKSITDVGAGAGSQSRCVDAHIIFRQHEEPGCVVLDAAVRSFAPIEPIALRWQYPLWMPDGSLDTAKLKGKLSVGEQRQGERDNEGITKLATAFNDGPASVKVLRGRSGLSKDRCERLLDQLEAKGSVKWIEEKIRGNACRVYEAVNMDDEGSNDTF